MRLSPRRCAGMLCAAALWIAGAPLARAQAPDPPEPTGSGDPAQADAADPPWARGVSQAQRDQANAYHARGLKAAKELFYSDALALYLEALEHWDHPKIRYNTAFVLIKLDQPIAAREHLLAAIAYGDAPLGAETYQNALGYIELLNSQLAEIEILCDERDVEVTLDGEPVPSGGKGAITRIVRPGNHQIVAKKSGMPTLVHRIPLWAEQHHRVAVRPGRAVHQRWSRWTPWVVLGAGAGVLAGGGVLHWRAQADFDSFDRRVQEECTQGCPDSELSPGALDLESRARWENRFAGGMFVVGGAVAVAGAAMVWLNRPQQHDERAFEVSVTPMVTPEAAGVSARASF